MRDESVERSGVRPVAERVRTVLARGAGGTVEAGMLRRPLRSARVRDDGVVVLVVDVGGMSRDSVDAPGVTAPGGSATVEIVDTVCTGRCRGRSVRPSFAIDGRPAGGGVGCDDECAVTRGVVRISGIVTSSSSARRRRLVAADGAEAGPDGDVGALRLSELRPLEVAYLSDDGVHVVPRGELVAAAVDPIGVDEQAWLRRLGADGGTLAVRLALGAGRQVAGADPWIVGLDRHGVDVAIGAPDTVFRERLRIPFSQVCAGVDDVERELAALLDGN